MTEFRSEPEPVPEWFAESLAPLVRRHPKEFTEDDTRDYFAILGIVPERWLKAAVIKHLRTAREAWMPMPSVLLDSARDLQLKEWQHRVKMAPPCPICGSSEDGMVDAVLRATGQRLDSLACICVRGERRRGRNFPAFDPRSMETRKQWDDRTLTVDPLPTKAITDQRAAGMTVPPSTDKPAREQRRALARYQKTRVDGVVPATKPEANGG